MNPGQPLEHYLSVIHANYRRQGKAAIFHVPTPVQITKHVGKGQVIGRTMPVVWVDYSGVVAGGLAVAIEAKSTTSQDRDTSRVRPAFPLSRLPQHQRAALADVHKLGGIAALYLRYTECHTGKLPFGSDYFVPAVYLNTLDRKSIAWDDVEKYKVPAGGGWIGAVENWNEYTTDGWRA